MIIKPINRDVALKLHEEEVKTPSGIFVIRDDSNDQVLTLEVIAVADKVTSVAVGDKVMVDWSRMTPPTTLTLDNQEVRVAFTSEDEILGIVE